VLWNLAMITGSLLGGILVEVAAGLPFLAAAALNVAAIGAVLALFRMPRVSETGMIGPVSASAAESDAR